MDNKEEIKDVAELNGIVISYPEKNAGFGFIKPTGDDKEMGEIFFHKSALKAEEITQGSKVVFEIGNHPKNDKGVVALNIRLVD